MKAHELMTNHVYKIMEKDTVRTFIERCVEYRISGMPIVNDRNEMVAYLSDGDIMRSLGKQEDIVVDLFFHMAVIKGDDDLFEVRFRKLLDWNVMAIAQKKVIAVAWDQEVEQIATILGKKHIKKVPVERDGVLVGIISRGDVIRHAFESLL
jgi:CBS domain-containing protein